MGEGEQGRVEGKEGQQELGRDYVWMSVIALPCC